HRLQDLRRLRREDRHRHLPGPPLPGELPGARAPGRRDHPDRLQHADLRAGARPQRALPAIGRLRQRLLRGRHRQGRRGRRLGADRRLLRHQSPGPGAREGRDLRRRARGLAHRPRPHGPGAQALELPRPPPAAALRLARAARDRKGAPPVSPRVDTPRVDTIVRGGKVVTASDIFEAAVAITGDKIAAIGPEDLLPPADRVIDAGGRFVLPGLIDCHLHVGPDYDDWKTAPLAAAQTGLTMLLPFVVYDEGETLPKAVARLREEAQALSVLDFGF